MKKLYEWLRDWLAWSVPAEVDPSLPQTLDEYRERLRVNAAQQPGLRQEKGA